MIFDWFDAREASRFGTSLADFVVERIPSKSPKKAPEALAKLFAQIERFKQTNRLNMYKKAKLGNAFKWKLRDYGYTDEFVDEITKEVLLHL
ncbi:MAG: hypothetical protein PHY45_11985 [Rhodocyclaceae bacterium]|nr:hypothetical protein [Rhodocyclaceae bacterium]